MDRVSSAGDWILQIAMIVVDRGFPKHQERLGDAPGWPLTVWVRWNGTRLGFWDDGLTNAVYFFLYFEPTFRARRDFDFRRQNPSKIICNCVPTHHESLYKCGMIL